ncbi:ATP-binding protein [Mycoplasma iguanae]|uniref:ATP-binding protein n=1 Tax=Mycoplasma iguanae TaxID=292461 RepID=A0ABY5R8V0_9MOLU|nr:ATP-binding protein [Mycoplasma iguanae]UVD81936.1 ATP-binding protein [Mycoplasma iguanae]
MLDAKIRHSKEKLNEILDNYFNDKSSKNLSELLKYLTKYNNIHSTIEKWKHKINKKLIIENLDIFIDMAYENYDNTKNFGTSFKVTDSNKIFRIYVEPVNKPENYFENNFRLTEITDFDFNVEKQRVYPSTASLLNEILNYPLLENNKGIYIWGNNSEGKTYVMQHLSIKYAKMGKTVAFINVNDLQKYLIDNLKNNVNNDIIKFMQEVDILTLDDWNSHRKSDWYEKILEEIVKYRNNKRKITNYTSIYEYKDILNSPELKKDHMKFRYYKNFVNSIKKNIQIFKIYAK